MSWFDSVNVDDIPDNPNELPNDTYEFQVIAADVKPTKAGDKTGITFKYQIVTGEWSSFFPITDWVRVPDGNSNPSENRTMLSYLKMRLLAFGFRPEEIQKFGKAMLEQCIGRKFYGTTSLKKDKGNTNIRVVKFDPVDQGSDAMIDFGDGPAI